MAKKKSARSTKMTSNSRPKMLGVKVYGGQNCYPGNVIVRQRGAKFLAGKNVRKGNDDTLYSAKEGKVAFRAVRKTKFDGTKRRAKMVEVE